MLFSLDCLVFTVGFRGLEVTVGSTDAVVPGLLVFSVGFGLLGVTVGFIDAVFSGLLVFPGHVGGQKVVERSV